ncbi:MAG: FxsA family protein [Deltaproteobacteria bacterium]|nr:FxsA family protein [Deltaproteobacteria bacterium]
MSNNVHVIGWLILAMTLVPLVELFLLIEIGQRVGAFPTIALVFLTGVAGAWLARSQGISILRRFNAEVAEGRMPTTTLVEGMLILVGGVLLLTPGVVTDLFGIVLLIPILRRPFASLVMGFAKKRIEASAVTFGPPTHGFGPATHGPGPRTHAEARWSGRVVDVTPDRSSKEPPS